MAEKLKTGWVPELSADEWREHARQGYGDDVLYDAVGGCWVVFKDPLKESSRCVCVKMLGGNYTAVEVKTLN